MDIRFFKFIVPSEQLDQEAALALNRANLSFGVKDAHALDPRKPSPDEQNFTYYVPAYLHPVAISSVEEFDNGIKNMYVRKVVNGFPESPAIGFLRVKD